MCVANGSRESHLREIKMGVTVFQYGDDGDMAGVVQNISNGQTAAHQPDQWTDEEKREWWKNHTPQLQIVPVSKTIRPTRKSRPMMERPVALRPAPKPANAAVTYKMAAPAYTH